jgi:hypothetical protein
VLQWGEDIKMGNLKIIIAAPFGVNSQKGPLLF